MTNIKTDMELTAHNFKTLVYPQIRREKWIKGILYNIENSPDKTLKTLDTNSSIDGFIKTTNGLIPIACRCQYGTSYSTFTIRKTLKSGLKTEYDKISYAIKNPRYVRPRLSIQAYLTRRNNGEIIEMAMAKTKDIFSCIREDKWRPAPGGNAFYYVDWDTLEENDKRLWRWRRNEN